MQDNGNSSSTITNSTKLTNQYCILNTDRNIAKTLLKDLKCTALATPKPVQMTHKSAQK